MSSNKENKLIFITKSGIKSKRDLGIPWENPKNDSFFWGKGISHFIAKIFVKEKLPFKIEIWHMNDQVERLTKKTVDGFLARVYPYSSFGGLPISLSFLRDIQKESKTYNTIIWFDGVRYPFFSLISFFVKDAKFVAHAMGGANYLYKYRKSRKIKFYLAYLFDKISLLKKVDLVFLGADGEFSYFQNANVCKQVVLGLDFNRWKITNKKEARKILGLPQDKKIILQMGRAFSFKGTEVTVMAWEKYLKNKDVLLYLTGVHPSDEHYELIKNSGCNYQGYIDHDLVPLWLAAADVYMYPPFDAVTLSFAGVGYAPLEALACGTPVVCTTARFFEFYHINEEEYASFVKIPKTIKQVAENTEELLKAQTSPEQCRMFAYKNFNQAYLFNKMRARLHDVAPLHFP